MLKPWVSSTGAFLNGLGTWRLAVLSSAGSEVHLDVRRHHLRPALEEGARLIWEGRGHTAAEQQPFGHRADEPVGPQVPVEGDGLGAGVGEDAVDMVLQVASDAGELVDHGNTVPPQLVAGPNAGEHENLRRVDRTAAEDDLALGADGPNAGTVQRTSTPVARPPSTTTRRTRQSMAIARLRRCRTGRRKAVEAEQRLPRLMVKS